MPKTIDNLRCPKCETILKRGKNVYYKRQLYDHLEECQKIDEVSRYFMELFKKYGLIYVPYGRPYGEVKHYEDEILSSYNSIWKKMYKYIYYWYRGFVQSYEFEMLCWLPYEVRKYEKYLDNLLYFYGKKCPKQYYELKRWISQGQSV